MAKHYTLWDYYPKKRFADHEINSTAVQVREFIWQFKDGNINAEVLSQIAKHINNFILQENCEIENCIFLTIPASTQQTTEKRFRRLCEILQTQYKIRSSFNNLHLDQDIPTKHRDKESRETSQRLFKEHLRFDSSLDISGKNIILFDDIITSGTTFEDCCNFLKQYNPKSVLGIFLGKTV